MRNYPTGDARVDNALAALIPRSGREVVQLGSSNEILITIPVLH